MKVSQVSAMCWNIHQSTPSNASHAHELRELQVHEVELAGVRHGHLSPGAGGEEQEGERHAGLGEHPAERVSSGHWQLLVRTVNGGRSTKFRDDRRHHFLFSENLDLAKKTCLHAELSAVSAFRFPVLRRCRPERRPSRQGPDAGAVRGLTVYTPEREQQPTMMAAALHADRGGQDAARDSGSATCVGTRSD